MPPEARLGGRAPIARHPLGYNLRERKEPNPVIDFEHSTGHVRRPVLIAISAIVSMQPTTNPNETEIRLADGRTMIARAAYTRLRDAINMIRDQFATLVGAA